MSEIELTDDIGRTIRLQAPAEKIVCLVPSITETLFAFGAGARVSGVTQFCIHPGDGVSSKPKVGGTKNFDVGAVLALQPDLVIANAEENRKHQVEKLINAGLNVFVTFPRTVAQCLKMMRDVSFLTGTRDAAAPIIADIESARSEAASRAVEPRPSVVCPIWKNPYMTVNRDTFVSDMIFESGGRNAFDDAPERYPILVLEEVARRQPEIIILPTEPYRFTEDDKSDFACLETIPAVRDRRIYVVEGELLSWYGPRVARALRHLSSLFGVRS